MAFIDRTEFDAVIMRLKQVIQPIVARHWGGGDKLSWRLMRTIELEAVCELQKAGDLNPICINLIRPTPAFGYPESDDPVDFGKSNAIAYSYSMIYEAYKRLHGEHGVAA